MSIAEKYKWLKSKLLIGILLLFLMISIELIDFQNLLPIIGLLIPVGIGIGLFVLLAIKSKINTKQLSVFYSAYLLALPIAGELLLTYHIPETGIGILSRSFVIISFFLLAIELRLILRKAVWFFALPLLFGLFIRLFLLNIKAELELPLVYLSAFVAFGVYTLFSSLRIKANRAEIALQLAEQKAESAINNNCKFNKTVRTKSEAVKCDEVQLQRENLKESYEGLKDSISYARKIQKAIFPTIYKLRIIIPEIFIINKPKDVVSGDFYWIKKVRGITYIAAVDCTGHGVPGAFLSIIGNNVLNRAVYEKHFENPNEILGFLSEKINVGLRQTQSESSLHLRDGMDLILCAYNEAESTISIAGVHNPLIRIRDGEMDIFKTDWHEVGTSFTEEFPAYNQQVIDVKKGDTFYIFSDGYADQFGGKHGRKLMLGRFRKALLDVHSLPLDEQEIFLKQRLKKWQGDYKQTDDILLVGFRLK